MTRISAPAYRYCRLCRQKSYGKSGSILGSKAFLEEMDLFGLFTHNAAGQRAVDTLLLSFFVPGFRRYAFYMYLPGLLLFPLRSGRTLALGSAPADLLYLFWNQGS